MTLAIIAYAALMLAGIIGLAVLAYSAALHEQYLDDLSCNDGE